VRRFVGRLDVLLKVIQGSCADYGNGWTRQVPSTLNVLKRRNLEERTESHDPECVAYCEMMCIRYREELLNEQLVKSSAKHFFRRRRVWDFNERW
jgi:hypothetical protein